MNVYIRGLSICMFMQVMALIAHLMEFKGNYGPHLIIVPNAVLVNWKVRIHCSAYFCNLIRDLTSTSLVFCLE